MQPQDKGRVRYDLFGLTSWGVGRKQQKTNNKKAKTEDNSKKEKKVITKRKKPKAYGWLA